MYRVFIQTNSKQLFGAYLARYALMRSTPEVDVQLMNVDTIPEFKKIAGMRYLRTGVPVTYDPNDLQSFTISRFLPPQLMGYRGRALVIDPDIFALADISPLFLMDLGGKSLAACPRRDAWDSSVMLLDCERLKHWNVATFLDQLRSQELDYDVLMTLRKESVLSLDRIWNSLDQLDEHTKMLHTTNRLTQPWKTGLKVDFKKKPGPPILGIIPREWIRRLYTSGPKKYQPHPDAMVTTFFFGLVRNALHDGVLDTTFIEEQIRMGHVRPDLLSVISAP